MFKKYRDTAFSNCKKKASLVVVGVNLLLKTVSLPFRALALVLNQLSPKLGYDHGVSISYQTLINTLCRVGLGLMKSHGKREDVWIGIVDFTMNQGPVRILPFLALSESRMNGNKATRLEDVECLDVIPMTRAKGSDIMTHYEALFERTGYPSAFLQDGGSNLNSAVNILNEKRASQKLPYIPVIRDVGHFSASITKGEFNQEDYIQGLLKQTTTFNSKVRPTQYAFLAAPKSRTAGRYMGYMKQVIRWLFRLENFTAGNGRPIEGSLRHYILEIFPNLYKTLKQVTSLVEVIEVEEFILKRLKTFGLTQSTYQSTIRKLKTLPEGHFYREAMMKWLEETWNIRKSIGIKGSLRVSSDIIETVNGLWKHITARAASNEVTHMALAFSTFFGSLTEEQIEWLIQDTPLWQVREWCDDKVPITQRKIKSMKFSPDTLLSEIDQLFAKYSPKISENTG